MSVLIAVLALITNTKHSVVHCEPTGVIVYEDGSWRGSNAGEYYCVATDNEDNPSYIEWVEITPLQGVYLVEYGRYEMGQPFPPVVTHEYLEEIPQ